MGNIVRGIRAWPARLLGATALLLSEKRTLRGFIVAIERGGGADDAIRKLSDALASIERVLPGVYTRLQEQVQRIVLVRAGGPVYWPFLRAIALTTQSVAQADPDLLAMTLVHEGAHARLFHRGIDYPRRRRAQIERICVGAEVRLARLLPDAAELERLAIAKLEREWWTNAAIGGRTRRAIAAATSKSARAP